MRAMLRMSVLALASFLLSGCLATGSLATRSTSIDEGVGTVQDRAILLNIVRASREQPLYFVSLGQIQATGTNDFRLGLPPIEEGPGGSHLLTFGVAGTSWFDATTNTNLTLNVYNTHDFYAGMMTPVALDEINLLLSQGFPRELVFDLVIEKARITPEGGTPVYWYNNPNDPTYPLFVSAIRVAMEHGLTVETAPAPDADAAPAKAADDKSDAAPAKAPRSQECFDEALATQGAVAEFARLKAAGKPARLCGAGPSAASASAVSVYLNGPDQPPVQVEVVFRSTYGIFKYLGRVMRDADGPHQPMLIDYHIAGETLPAGRLLMVRSGDWATAGCFTALSYQGRHYCVPQEGEGAEATKNIFDMLNALVALKQAPGDLPVSQPVLIAR